MLPKNKLIQKILICSLLVFAGGTVLGQSTQPTWWFGVSGAANLNFYDGTTQRLNNSLIVPTAFHDGIGVRPYGSVLVEYRPGRIWGGMLNVGYDGRGAKFDDVTAPCNCPATLKTNVSYLTLEPSLRLGAAESNFYFFAGPRLAYNLQKNFKYTQLKQPDTESDLTEMRKMLVSGQVGVGYDFDISSPNSTTKINLSPFLSFHPYFGQDPRKIESWTITSLRAGIALKFGKGAKEPVKEISAPLAVVPVKDVSFSIREPQTISTIREVSETLPLRSSVFFEDGSTAIPARYIMLSKSQADSFRESQLQQAQSSANMTGRSARQLNVYHNILNILGDRLRSNPGTAISLTGASGSGPQEGKLFAESIKKYLVDTYGIDASRISTEGRTKPLIPSEQPGGTRELVLLRAGDTRVDIGSTSAELLSEVGGGAMKPVQIMSVQANPLDSHAIFNVVSATDVFQSWVIDLEDEKGTKQHYGPFTKDQESIPGAAILGNRTEGYYKVTMNGTTKNGLSITKENNMHLVKHSDITQKGFRYSILFDFNKENAVAAYDKFLRDIVSPLISNGSTVIVHGHTDIIGEEDYNYKLSQARAQETQRILESALSATGKTNVKFETSGFGEDLAHAPFDNDLPEERFYNRTVIIDIIPVK